MKKLTDHLTPGAKWLDLGCGCRVVPQWMADADDVQAEFNNRVPWMVGTDCDWPSLKKNKVVPRRVQSEVGRLPFADSSFDLITANMVVEHLTAPELVLSEVRRVLRPGGVFLFQTPNLLNPMVLIASLFPQRVKNRIVNLLEGREDEDIFPVCYRMNRSGAIKKLAQRLGMAVHEVRFVESSAETVMLGPLVIFELMWIRLTRLSMLRWLRSDIIAVLGKTEQVKVGQITTKPVPVVFGKRTTRGELPASPQLT